MFSPVNKNRRSLRPKHKSIASQVCSQVADVRICKDWSCQLCNTQQSHVRCHPGRFLSKVSKRQSISVPVPHFSLPEKKSKSVNKSISVPHVLSAQNRKQHPVARCPTSRSPTARPSLRPAAPRSSPPPPSAPPSGRSSSRPPENPPGDVQPVRRSVFFP